MILPIKSAISGYDDTEWFTVDYRNLRDPIIEHHHVQFYILGEFYKRGMGCEDYYPHIISAKNIPESQLAVSNEAASCMVN